MKYIFIVSFCPSFRWCIWVEIVALAVAYAPQIRTANVRNIPIKEAPTNHDTQTCSQSPTSS